MDIPPISSKNLPLTSPQGPAVRSQRKLASIFWIFGVLCFCVIGATCVFFFPRSPLYAWRHAILPMVLGREYVVAQMGEVGEQYFDVKIIQARLLKPGRIVITFRDHNPLIFGISPFIPKGTVRHAEFRIPNIPTDPEIENAMPPLPRGTHLGVSIIYDDALGDGTMNVPRDESEWQMLFARGLWGVTSFDQMTL